MATIADIVSDIHKFNSFNEHFSDLFMPACSYHVKVETFHYFSAKGHQSSFSHFVTIHWTMTNKQHLVTNAKLCNETAMIGYFRTLHIHAGHILSMMIPRSAKKPTLPSNIT